MKAEPEPKLIDHAPLTLEELRIMEVQYLNNINIGIVIQQAIKRRIKPE